MDISPLNLANAGGTEPTGQKIFGIPTSVGAGSSSGIQSEQDSEPTADKVSKCDQGHSRAGRGAVIDNTVKYVDENGLIGMNISTQLDAAQRHFQPVRPCRFGRPGLSITLPDFFVRTTRTRVNLRDGQTVAIDGLIDKETHAQHHPVPFLSKIPIFSAFFKNHADDKTNEEVIVLVTPHIVRMRDPTAPAIRSRSILRCRTWPASRAMCRSSSRFVTTPRRSTFVRNRPRT
jgi:hypothetical protein